MAEGKCLSAAVAWWSLFYFAERRTKLAGKAIFFINRQYRQGIGEVLRSALMFPRHGSGCGCTLLPGMVILLIG